VFDVKKFLDSVGCVSVYDCGGGIWKEPTGGWPPPKLKINFKRLSARLLCPITRDNVFEKS
jgi:hypothetical protein